MKLRLMKSLKKRLPILNKKGQSLIEYLMLMLVITGLSTLFITQVNSKLAGAWVNMIDTIADEPQKLTKNDLK